MLNPAEIFADEWDMKINGPKISDGVFFGWQIHVQCICTGNAAKTSRITDRDLPGQSSTRGLMLIGF